MTARRPRLGAAMGLWALALQAVVPAWHALEAHPAAPPPRDRPEAIWTSPEDSGHHHPFSCALCRAIQQSRAAAPGGPPADPRAVLDTPTAPVGRAAAPPPSAGADLTCAAPRAPPAAF